jgi:WD40 repeat protein
MNGRLFEMGNSQSPYVGPRPFNPEDSDFFFGRNQEADKLLSLITAHPVVLLYSPSGAGKTSLVNAELIPLLRGEGFDVLPPARVQSQTPINLPFDQIENLFVFNALMDWCREETDQSKFARKSLAEFLKDCKCPERINSDNVGFEEPTPRVIIFDQFEEILRLYPERWKDRYAFFEQVRDAIAPKPKKRTLEGTAGSSEMDPLLRVVLVMREDYIAGLDSYMHLLPEKLRTRFRLEHLREKAAKLAVTEPLKGTGRVFEDGVAEELVNNLLKVPSMSPGSEWETGQYVEPLQLQVVCDSLWLALEREESVITREHLIKHGDVNQALSAFYERSIKSVAEETGVTEGALRMWFGKKLIRAEGVRGIVYRGDTHTADLANSAVDALDKLHLIKGELRGMASWYELAHDRLIAPIRSSNEKWIAGLESVGQTSKHLENRADEWNARGRGPQGLFDEADLRLVKVWQEKGEAAGLIPSKNLLDMIKASQSAQSSRSRRLLSKAVAALVIVVVAMGILSTWAILERRNAVRLATDVQIKSAEYHVAAIEAQKAKDNAMLQGIEANNASFDANFQRSLALKQKAEAEKQLIAAKKAEAEASIQQGLAQQARDSAKHESQLARSREAAASAVEQLNKDPELGVRLAIEAAQISPTDEAQSALRNAAPLLNRKPALLKGHHEAVTSAVISPDSRYLITVANRENVARLWELADDKPFETEEVMRDKFRLKYELQGHELPVQSAVFSGDSKYILTTASDETARVWSTSTGKAIAILKGHKGPVTRAVFIPNNEFIATAGVDKTLRLWKWRPSLSEEATDGQQPAPIVLTESVILAGHERWITVLLASPDGKLLATEATDSTGRLWNLDEIKNKLEEIRTGKELPSSLVLKGLTGPVSTMAFSPDGKRLVTEGVISRVDQNKDEGDRYVAKVWDTTAGWGTNEANLLFDLVGHKGAITSVSFSPDKEGKYILTASADETARIWNVSSEKPDLITELHGHVGPVSTANFSPDGARVVTSGFDSTAQVWDVSSGRNLAVLRGHTGNLSSAIYSPNGQFIVTTSADRNAGVWNATIEQKAALRGVTELHGHAAEVFSASFSPDSKYVLTGSWDGSARLWDMNTGQALRALNGHASLVLRSAFSPDGNFIVTASADGTARVWDIRNCELKANADGTVRVWGTGGEDEPKVLRGHTNAVMSVAFSSDGKLIVTASLDKTWRVWAKNDKGDWNEVASTTQAGEVYSAAFSHDGSHVVTTSKDHAVIVWKKRNGSEWAEEAPLQGHRGVVCTGAFSNDGRYIVTASFDGTAIVWMKTGQDWTSHQSSILRGHTHALFSGTFSADDKYILTTSADKTARVWVKTGVNDWELRSVLRRQNGYVYGGAFSDGNQFIATASADGIARIYPAGMFEPFQDVLARVIGRGVRDLTTEERKEYLHETEKK